MLQMQLATYSKCTQNNVNKCISFRKISSFKLAVKVDGYWKEAIVICFQAHQLHGQVQGVLVRALEVIWLL